MSITPDAIDTIPEIVEELEAPVLDAQDVFLESLTVALLIQKLHTASLSNGCERDVWTNRSQIESIGRRARSVLVYPSNLPV